MLVQGINRNNIMTTPLKTLQRLRQFELDRCRIVLGNAQRQKCVLCDRLESVKANQAKQRTDLELLTSGEPVAVSTLRVHHAHLADISAQIFKLQPAINAAEQEVQIRITALIAAEQQLKVAERLHSRSENVALTFHTGNC
jgi:flagellar biosynthesis chaperone FliJ